MPLVSTTHVLVAKEVHSGRILRVEEESRIFIQSARSVRHTFPAGYHSFDNNLDPIDLEFTTVILFTLHERLAPRELWTTHEVLIGQEAEDFVAEHRAAIVAARTVW